MKHEGPIELAQAGAGSTAFPRALGFAPAQPKLRPFVGHQGRVALISNGRAHRNRTVSVADQAVSSAIRHAAPPTKAELDRTLASFAAERIDTIVIDGGDGTIRDVLSLAHRHFTDGMPRFALVPSGKTNALAIDLGVSSHWSARDVLSSLSRWKTIVRSPVEIRYDGAEEVRLRGFLFGTGAFVRATNLAQSVHRAGAFNGLAVGLSLAGAVAQTLFGGQENIWRRGDAVTIELPDGRAIERSFYMLLGSTMERLPLGLKPFGRIRQGLKLLGVDAHPRQLVRSLPALLSGSEKASLFDAGYKRVDVDGFRLRIDGSFVLDGEAFRGGNLEISRGAPIDFLVPA